MSILLAESITSSRLLAPWRALADLVRRDHPDVVILIARKVPRLVELFNLNFGTRCLVVSDIAVPFCHTLIRGRRVAVVDDLVNVGTTLAHARDCVVACGAREVNFYALGKRDGSPVSDNVNCVFPDPLSDEQYESLAYDAPIHLRRLNKPFDLEFPTIQCRLLPPFSDGDQLLAYLRSRFGSEAVHDVTLRPATWPLRRLTVDVDDDDCGNYKLRLYLDESTGNCNLVPFAIPAGSGLGYVGRRAVSQSLIKTTKRALLDVPHGASLWPDEPIYRVMLYARSLDLGLDSLDMMSPALCVKGAAFDREDAQMLFGPTAKLIFDNSPGDLDVLSNTASEEASTQASPTPFWKSLGGFEDSPLFKRVKNETRGTLGADHVLAVFFDILAQMTGASNTTCYSLTHIYSAADVQKKPYLRLRIGPTFADLVSLVRQLGLRGTNSQNSAKHLVSATLDHLIDEGGVVPTLAKYGDTLWRIYRKGETPPRELAVGRLCYAVDDYPQPLRLTQIAKIEAILSFSNRIDDVTVPFAMARGHAASIPSGVLDSETVDIATYSRDIGRLHLKRGGE